MLAIVRRHGADDVMLDAGNAKYAAAPLRGHRCIQLKLPAPMSRANPLPKIIEPKLKRAQDIEHLAGFQEYASGLAADTRAATAKRRRPGDDDADDDAPGVWAAVDCTHVLLCLTEPYTFASVFANTIAIRLALLFVSLFLPLQAGYESYYDFTLAHPPLRHTSLRLTD